MTLETQPNRKPKKPDSQGPESRGLPTEPIIDKPAGGTTPTEWEEIIAEAERVERSTELKTDPVILKRLLEESGDDGSRDAIDVLGRQIFRLKSAVGWAKKHKEELIAAAVGGTGILMGIKSIGDLIRQSQSSNISNQTTPAPPLADPDFVFDPTTERIIPAATVIAPGETITQTFEIEINPTRNSLEGLETFGSITDENGESTTFYKVLDPDRCLPEGDIHNECLRIGIENSQGTPLPPESGASISVTVLQLEQVLSEYPVGVSELFYSDGTHFVADINGRAEIHVDNPLLVPVVMR